MRKYSFEKIKTFGNYTFTDGSSDRYRLMTIFKDTGAFIISACRGNFKDFPLLEDLESELDFYGVKYNEEDLLDENCAGYKFAVKKWNEAKTEELEGLIREKGLGFRPSYGGYVEGGNDIVNEVSFIVPYKDVMSRQAFAYFAVELCGKYHQDSVLVCMKEIEDGKPTYLTKNYDVDMVFDKTREKTEKDPYFTLTKKHNSGAFSFYNDSLDNLVNKICNNHLIVTTQCDSKNKVYDSKTGWSKEDR